MGPLWKQVRATPSKSGVMATETCIHIRATKSVILRVRVPDQSWTVMMVVAQMKMSGGLVIYGLWNSETSTSSDWMGTPHTGGPLPSTPMTGLSHMPW